MTNFEYYTLELWLSWFKIRPTILSIFYLLIAALIAAIYLTNQ